VEQFVRETSERASDLHHLGRFSKRFALVYSRDPSTTEMVVQGAIGAILTLVPHTLARLPASFTLEDLVLRQLELSYLGEQRVVEPTKARALYEAGRAYYREIYPEVLALHTRRFGTPVAAGDETYRQPRIDRRRQTERFLGRSRRRGVLRWPKYMLTVEDWLGYVLYKLERHHGVQIELTPLQRRFPLLFCWPVFLRLRRQGLVR